MFRYCLTILLFSFLAFTRLHAQDWEKDVKDPSSFFNLQKAYYKNEVLNKDPNEEEQDGANELYERWAQFMLPRVNADGKSMAPNVIYKEWAKYQQQHPSRRVMYKQATWQYAGPPGAPGNGGGTGRINCLRRHPGNKQILWAGTPDGGLWKSTDAGRNWSNLTDSLPNLGISDIAINPQHPDTMYIATGDGYGYAYTNGQFWGGSYSNGVMKSTDGGQSWAQTTLNYDQTQSRQVYKLLIYPADPNLLLAATNNGIWRSTDAGGTWKQMLSNDLSKIIFHPTNPSIVYASGGGYFFYSTDAGATWKENSAAFTSLGYAVIPLAVTPAQPDAIFALAVTYSDGVLYKSRDKGLTWVNLGGISKNTFYGKYASVVAVSPKDTNHILTGGVNLVESFDGGNNWGISAYNYYGYTPYVHPDHRVLEFVTNDTIYDGNDGGIYKGGKAPKDVLYDWNLISSGIHTLQFYGVGSANSKPGRFFAGAQDNGINRSNNGAWDHVVTADGMLCAVDNANPNIVYANTQYGYVHKSTNGGSVWSQNSIGPFGNFNWVTPLVINPHDSKVLYYGGDVFYKSVNTPVSINSFPRWDRHEVDINNKFNIGQIAVSHSDTSFIYVVKQSDYYPNTAAIYRSENGGISWTNISKGLPKGYVYISGIDVDRVDSLKIYLSISGFLSGQKVFMSKNGGDTWTNISGSLPNVPANCINVEGSTRNGIYVGTDVGVFYRNDDDTDWVRYSEGLPNVIIDKMEVLPSINKLRAATYGRGIWEGELAGTLTSIVKSEAIQQDIAVFPNPSTGLLNISMPDVKGVSAEVNIFNMLGEKILTLKAKDFYAGTASIDLNGRPAGIYTLIFNIGADRVVKKALIIK
jgi:photosystem II stability/assembly factor-like uncharacterized protein